jgi:hypothetical protein
MSRTPPTTQNQLPANLAALQQSLQEFAVKINSAAPTTKEKPAICQGPFMVVRGK